MAHPESPVPRPQPPLRLILASGSPRRRELLQEAGYEFTVMPPAEDVECGVCSESGPAGLVAELAYRKAMAVHQQLVNSSQMPGVPSGQQIIVGADTVAECDGFILGKPRDEVMARAMLKQLSGRDHRVLTGVCLLPLPPGEGWAEGALGRCRKSLLPADMLKFARQLRKSQTDAESLLWSLLRDRRFGGCKFRRQFPVGRFILDFFCHEKNLAIELDGGQHNTDLAREADKSRSEKLNALGIRVVRLWNHDVLADTETVLEAIWNALQSQGTLTPDPSPQGRGEPMIRVAVSKLRMDLLTDAQLDEYLESGQWEGKAGSFGYQDRLGWVHIVEGSESNVVGLPLELLAEMLAEIRARGET
jgi:predicted house-cleaning NTP pyrophosphatase (Maf/HAM1 superfamily)/very-short-patch-repair endonuclease